MGTEPLNYWFDSQLRRYASQFCRVFQNFQYQIIRNGEPEFRPVPVKYGMSSAQVAAIITQNSQNVMLSVPVVACYISDVRINRGRTQAPYYIDRQQIIEREYNEEYGAYTTESGNRYQLDRIMPTPLDLNLKADVWVSNQLQKDQLFEQMVTLFNPSIDLQHSDNPFDWNALTILELEDIAWSSRQIPIGNIDEIEMFTLTFKSEVWLQPPSWLHPQKLIQQIITNIGESETMIEKGLNQGFDVRWSSTDLLSRIIVSPGNHQLRVNGDTLTLLGEDGGETDEHGEKYSWEALLEVYGKYRPNISQIRLKEDADLDDDSNDIIGTFALSTDPEKPNELTWYIDGMTIPTPTLDPITGALDPFLVFPNHGLPSPTNSTRYMILSDIGDGVNSTIAWGSLQAKANDIIQYNENTHTWGVVFDSSNEPDIQYLTNSKTGKQLRWDGSNWIVNIEGEYRVGYWRVYL